LGFVDGSNNIHPCGNKSIKLTRKYRVKMNPRIVSTLNPQEIFFALKPLLANRKVIMGKKSRENL
jgi:hypothetical protein